MFPDPPHHVGTAPKEGDEGLRHLRWPSQARANLAMMLSCIAFLKGDDAAHQSPT
jgi:hypothetical protein